MKDDNRVVVRVEGKTVNELLGMTHDEANAVPYKVEKIIRPLIEAGERRTIVIVNAAYEGTNESERKVLLFTGLERIIGETLAHIDMGCDGDCRNCTTKKEVHDRMEKKMMAREAISNSMPAGVPPEVAAFLQKMREQQF